MKVHCLHTAASNVAPFDAARFPGMVLHHTVRADFLARAELEGGMSATLEREVRMLLVTLRNESDAVVLSCSTLGPAADGWAGVVRSDAALARALAEGGSDGSALCAAPTTLAPTRALFASVARHVSVEFVAGAWPLFRAGEMEAYHACVAQAADAAFARGVARVGLVQVSMAKAAPQCRNGVPLTAPGVALMAAVQ